MDQFKNKEIMQAILIADNNIENFRPLSEENSTALLNLVNVPFLDYALEALNRSGIEEVFIYSSHFLQNVREHIKQGILSHSSWSINMTVHVIGGEGCRCFGDAMRDLDAKALIRGNFVLLGANTVFNVDLRSIFEQHKKMVKYDKGNAATLIFKEGSSHIRTKNEVIIAMDTSSSRLYYHQRLRMSNHKEPYFEIPLETFAINSEVAIYHNVSDPQIAIGSPSMLSLFSDNFDFETRDDFVRGLLINEEILDSRIYVSLLPREQYARRVDNWLTYQIVSQDVINRWAYPLVPDMGVHCLSQQYIFLKNNIYRSPKASVTKVELSENVVVQKNTAVERGCTLSCSVIGPSCKIGKNCKLYNVYLMENVVLGEHCSLEHCIIGARTVIGSNSEITNGTVIGSDCVIPEKTQLSNVLVKSFDSTNNHSEGLNKTLGSKAFIIKDNGYHNQETAALGSDSEDDDLDQIIGYTPKMGKLDVCTEESDYVSTSEDDEDSGTATPLPDDTNIFLSEVIDSLSRGFEEKSNPDFLILEINSSRYAYNMSLQEVNFYVVKAFFSLPSIKEPTNNNILIALHNTLKQLGPILSNYIKTHDAMIDCLKAIQDVYEENELLREKISQVVHYLYDKDYVSEESIVSWYNDIDNTEQKALKSSLTKIVEWLNQSSDEDESSE